jgi:two-component system, OmpR family, response regulator VicR
MDKKALTTGEIADWCGVNLRTVLRWIGRGELKAFRLPGPRGDNRILFGDFLEFLKNHQMPIPQGLGNSTPKLLLVEDNPADAKLFAKSLEGAGYDIRHASNGFQAGALLGTFSPDVVALDLKMPGMTGLEVIKMIRGLEQTKKFKILIVSAMDRPHLDEALRAGADDVLQKPYDYRILLEKLSRLVEGKTKSGTRAPAYRRST